MSAPGGDKAHALLGPSSANKWLNCPGSARLEATIEEAPSEHAELGQLAHAFAELELRKNFQSLSASAYRKEYNALKKSPLYSAEIDRCVAEYVYYISEIAYSKPVLPSIFIEQKINQDNWVPEGFGTADCVLISGTELTVIDYKHGTGVAVSAYDNPQLKLYGLGAYDRYKRFYDIRTVNLAIVQPRKGGVSEWQLPIEDLTSWGDTIVKPAAEKAFAGVNEFVPGPWCDKGFCRAAGTCKVRTEQMVAAADDIGLQNQNLITADDMSAILSRCQGFAAWLKKLEAAALGKILAGEEIEGWKAVEGRSNRTIPDENIKPLEAALIEKGYKKAALYERKFLGLTALETLVGKKELAEVAGDYIIKPPGKPALAPASDSRKEYSVQKTAEDMFGKTEGDN